MVNTQRFSIHSKKSVKKSPEKSLQRFDIEFQCCTEDDPESRPFFTFVVKYEALTTLSEYLLVPFGPNSHSKRHLSDL